MNEIDYLKKQLSYLWRAIYIMAVFIIVTIVIAVISVGSNSYDGDNGFVRKEPFRTEIQQINRRLDISEVNSNNLFRNDSLIVANQRKMQNGQKVTSFLSFLGKVLL
jgi:hypothetical protein